MGRRKGWTIGKTRSALYTMARILGDINAIKRGTVGRRIVRRILGKVAGRILGALTR